MVSASVTAHALNKLAFFPHALQQLLDLRAATMHDHDIETHQLEQDHVARETALEVLFGHGIAAVFDDNGLAVKTLDVRQGLGEHAGLERWGKRIEHGKQASGAG
jgi:hypothetical protein